MMFIGFKGSTLKTSLSRPSYKTNYSISGYFCGWQYWKDIEKSYCKLLLLRKLIKSDVSFNITIKQRANFIIYKNSTKNNDSNNNSNNNSDNNDDGNSNGDTNGNNKGDSIKNKHTQDEPGALINLEYVVAFRFRPSGY